MAEPSKPKYDSLPGIDTAPDVYETPDLDHETSTIQASTTLSSSASATSGASDDEEESGIRRHRFEPDSARERFQPARVDARGVDFSDNVAAQHRSYRTSTRGQRQRGEILGEDSSDEEREGFAAKLARVRREVLELEREYEGRVQSGEKAKMEEGDARAMMEFVSEKVDRIYAERRGGVRGAEPLLERTIAKFEGYQAFGESKGIKGAIERQPPLPGSQVQRSQLEVVLDQAADFDERIAGVERVLGLSGSSMPDVGENPPFPVFTTLEKFEQTLATLGEASSGGLETTAQHIKKLIADADALKISQADAERSLSEPSGKPLYNTDQETKINALYGTIPTIDKLSPLLPLVLERLRTLRLVHTSAYQADEVLTELEHRQSKQEEEIKKWEISLDNIENDIKVSEKSLQHNMKVVGDWVKGLEARIDKLP
ncbi:hypothetical protein P154DRAFT_554804 [Amniculicola lignicola CBS 123094]|uniref:Dynactin-like protein subunit 2 n=1 Tax=Amniculicola lignicola CBS 123094 TaxID=1392246 RepID=A0A6A5WGM7_9PLEO|nr:hypothetical protein P154DRAFT_554804 [Amniculicola lignicola CBS 123094]